MTQYQNDIVHTTAPHFAKNRIRFVVVGEKGVGKTSLVRRIVDNVYRENSEEPDRFQQQRLNITMRVFDSTFYKLEFQEVDAISVFGAENRAEDSDIPAVHEVVSIPWYDVQSVIFVYDIAERNSYERLYQHLPMLQKKASPDCDICLVGTKSDEKSQRQIPFSEAEKDAELRDMSLFEVSSKDGQNVNLLLEEMVEKAIDRKVLQMECGNTENEDAEEVYRDPTISDESVKPSILCWWPFGKK